MTEEDKALLRQYEGAGGLAEKGATTHGTLYEFYTPQKVVDKVWSLVDKYNPRTDKTVIEPSAGTGRFAEGRSESFNLFELDKTSARIAGILHPDAQVKQGAFQELFMNGRTPKKKYDGKTYDVAIGNPPYGAYSGLYKGMGEGKEHSYIHEYFIDRSLDTLKDGGILAMVVPSSFLRGKNSKAKEQIAGKAKILEAWRLPNGTFGTTEVGTDIIVLRKETGDIADFTDNKYFETYEDHIVGVERDKQGKFGIEKYVAPPDGMGFDESLELIDLARVAYAPDGEKTPEQQAIENVEVKTSEAEEHENRSDAMMGNDNAAGDRGGQGDEHKKKRRKKDEDTFTPSIGKSLTADEFNEKYGIVTEKADLPIWKATDYDGRIEVSKLSAKYKEQMETSGNFTVDGAGNWYSISNYASGNIYDKLDQLERDREVLGEERYKINKSLLEAVKPQPKNVEHFTVSPISDFAKEYKMVDDEGTERDLRDAFFKWAGVETRRYGRKTYRSIDWNESPISQFEIPSGISFSDVIAYIGQESLRTDKATAREFDAETAKMEKEDKRKKRREAAENLFNRFLREGLTDGDRKSLQETWNRRFNSVVNPDYTKIPIAVNGMNTHKGEEKFDLLQQQVKGISFLCNKGNGILAHEVGIGKTVEGIVATVNQMQTGRSKKPLICVPKAVYRKWIKEIHQHFPDIKVNELENFSDKNIAGFRDGEGGLNIEPRTISVCTYEALSKVTFKDETIDEQLIDDILDSQTIYDNSIGGDLRSNRDLAKEKEDALKKLGAGIKAKEGAVLWENTGFDNICVDEFHNFRNIFGSAKVFTHSKKDIEGEGQAANEFQGLSGGTSDRAMKLFAITQLIQRENKGRNVFGLSATPFNNSPIEVYNILSLVAREKLKEMHIFNMHEFLAEFADLKAEWSVKANGEIEQKQVMKNWKNLGALQNLLSEYFDYVTADEAGVIRPIKKTHEVQLELSPLQRAIIAAETEYMSTADPKEDPGATLKAINNMRMATLSPSLIDESRYAMYRNYEGWPGDISKEPKRSDFVSASPKMKFVCDSIVKCWKENKQSGQIMYLPRGVNDFIHVRDYLVSQGMPEDSVEFMHSKTSLDDKEKIKNDFNDPDGKCKVVIGSETIKEGVSLNGNTISIYNCMLGWNPTEAIQVEGRAWRQGNEQGHVHIVYPLMADSIDSLMYQKFDEKASRINALWSYKGDTLDSGDLDPETLKFDLIKDPAKKARYRIGLEKEKIQNDVRMEETRYEVLFRDSQLLEKNEGILPSYKRDMDTAEAEMIEARKKRDEWQKKLDKEKKEEKASGKQPGQWEGSRGIAQTLDSVKWELERAKSNFTNGKWAYKEVKDIVDAINAKFNRLDITPQKVDAKLKDISAHIVKMKAEIGQIESRYNEYFAKAKSDLEAAKVKLPPLDKSTATNVRAIMDDLRPMKEVRGEIKAKRAAGMKKSFVFYKGKIYLNRRVKL